MTRKCRHMTLGGWKNRMLVRCNKRAGYGPGNRYCKFHAEAERLERPKLPSFAQYREDT